MQDSVRETDPVRRLSQCVEFPRVAGKVRGRGGAFTLGGFAAHFYGGQPSRLFRHRQDACAPCLSFQEALLVKGAQSFVSNRNPAGNVVASL
jgi:hypothetical protein